MLIRASTILKDKEVWSVIRIRPHVPRADSNATVDIGIEWIPCNFLT